jgi:hypothetical protein
MTMEGAVVHQMLLSNESVNNDIIGNGDISVKMSQAGGIKTKCSLLFKKLLFPFCWQHPV